MIESWLPFLVPLLPLAGFVITGALGRRMGKGLSAFVSCAMPLLSFMIVASVFFRFLVGGVDFAGPQTDLGSWITIGQGKGSLDLGFVFRLDRLSTIMCLIVTGVGSLIHIYSAGYMASERPGRFARYFCYLNLFTAMMLVLVTGDSLPLMFIGWEGVGLCSYLLIGFEYEEGWKADAGMKAFIVNRVGDFAFIVGMILIYIIQTEINTGPAGLKFDAINQLASAGAKNLSAEHFTLMGIAALLLFIGATGKSAQIPLFVWLPDAMAGPTPVSALIHAATMVTAGVYMCVRLGYFFSIATVGGVTVLSIVAVIGALTAFVAATAAIAQSDIKKVLAYSTVSQLGYMFIGVGTMAYTGAVFHLMTHAFFKALLFLGSGAVIHALHGEQNIFRMGGLRRYLPVCWWSFAIGGVALAGVPPLAGFWSKDGILFSVYEQIMVTGGAWSWIFIYILGLAGAAITAFYTTRLLIITFFGRTRLSKDQLSHLHRPDGNMKFALYILMVLSLVGGLVGVPKLLAVIVPGEGEHLQRFLEVKDTVRPGDAQQAYVTRRLSEVRSASETALTGEALKAKEQELTEEFEHAHHSAELWSLALSLLVVAGGFALAYRKYRPGLPEELEPGSLAATGHELLREAWGLDQFYASVVVAPLKAISVWVHHFIDDGLFDKVILDGSGRVSVLVGRFVTVWQSGRVTSSVLYIVVGSLALLWVVMG